jgi:hypothetical protein
MKLLALLKEIGDGLMLPPIKDITFNGSNICYITYTVKDMDFDFSVLVEYEKDHKNGKLVEIAVAFSTRGGKGGHFADTNQGVPFRMMAHVVALVEKWALEYKERIPKGKPLYIETLSYSPTGYSDSGQRRHDLYQAYAKKYAAKRGSNAVFRTFDDGKEIRTIFAPPLEF